MRSGSTLEEVTEADALLHVVDLSHAAWQNQIHSVMGILSEMPITPGPILLVFNKIDSVDGDTLELAKEEYPQPPSSPPPQDLGLGHPPPAATAIGGLYKALTVHNPVTSTILSASPSRTALS